MRAYKDLSVKAQVQEGAELLVQVSSEPRRDASLLLCFATGKDRTWVLTNPHASLTAAQKSRYHTFLARRLQHEPMQYILGEQEFYGLPLHVTPAVLIPRPETEHLVEAVLTRLPHSKPVRIADVGTGSGAIALALAHKLPLAQIDALDISLAALNVARENVQTLGFSERVRFVHSDLLAAVAGERYDCIVSNPPYVADTDTLEPQVMNWEPHMALFAGADGLAVYRLLLPQAANCLVPDGLFAVEIGAGQQQAIKDVFMASSHWNRLRFLPDLQGIARVALAWRR